VIERDSGVYYVRRNFSLGPDNGSVQKVASLKTKNRAEALRRFPTVSAGLQAAVEARRRDEDGYRHGRSKTQSIEDEARFWREEFSRAATDQEHDNVEAGFDATVDDLLGNPIGEDRDHETGQPIPVYDSRRESKALALIGMIRGNIIPVDFHFGTYLTARQFKGRADYKPKQATKLLAEWLTTQPEGNSIRTIGKRIANLFTEHLLTKGRHPRTVKAMVSALSGYWKWLERREEVDTNPWQDVALDARVGKADKRGFTEAEALTLLSGPAAPYMTDLIRVGALTGMRLNEIGRLTVKDAEDGWFRVRESKTKAGVRLVPIHPDLTDLITKRTKDRQADDWLFDDLPPSKSASRGRADKAGEAFTRYRRAMKVEDLRDDGLSRVSFHSFRSWFITAAINAGAQPHFVSALVGHAEGRRGMTLDTYYDGPNREALVKAVNSVCLPEPKATPKVSGLGVATQGR
jgi:integrase